MDSTQPISSLLQMPDAMLGLILEKCDIKTNYSLKATCAKLNTLCETYMSEESASRRVFHDPELYKKIQVRRLKESPIVAEIALSFIPELIEDQTTSLSIQQNEHLIKTAFVAATILHRKELAQSIQRHNPCTSGVAIELLIAPKQFLFRNNPFPFEEIELLTMLPFVLKTVTECGTELNYMRKRFQNNKDIILRALHQSAEPLASIPADFKDNPEFMLEAIRKNGDAYAYASERLKDNDAFVLSICQLDGWLALYYASERIRNLEEIVIVAIQQNPNAICFIGTQVQVKFSEKSPHKKSCCIQ